MAAVHPEIESKFDIPPDYVVPDLTDLVPGSTTEVDTVRLSATYYDTADLDLLKFHLALRRREGGDDSGWHLKIPAKTGRTELRWPLSYDKHGMPDEADTMLRPFLRGKPVNPVVRIDTSRTRTRLCNGTQMLIEIARDDVRAVGLSRVARAPRWHELEAELEGGDEALLDAVGERLIASGAYASRSHSKLSRALLGIDGEDRGVPPSTAGDVLKAYISKQCDAIVAGNFAIRHDADDSVHQTRVGCRRLRSTLRSFSDYFDEASAVHLDAELRWYAGVLGEVRDREVLRRRLLAAVDDLGDEYVVGPVREHIDTTLTGEMAQYRAEALDVMDGSRYADLLAETAGFRERPPFTPLADRPASVLSGDLERIEQKLAKRLRRATKPHGTDEEMHDARKTAKRTRYANETADGVVKGASTQAGLAEQLQDVLGEFQDGVVAKELIERLAADAWTHGENAFSYGILIGREEHRSQDARRKARKRVRR